jgi:hypothetical protein
MPMKVKTESFVKEPGRHCKRILKINGDMRIGGVAIGCGDDVNQQDRAIDIMRGQSRKSLQSSVAKRKEKQ